MEVSNTLPLTVLSYPSYSKHHHSILGVAKCQWSMGIVDHKTKTTYRKLEVIDSQTLK